MENSLDQLTGDFHEKLNRFRNQWLHIGANAGKINRIETAEIVEMIYRKSGLEKPTIFWYDSPRDIKNKTGESWPIFQCFTESIIKGWGSTQRKQRNLKLHHYKRRRPFGVIEDQIRVALFVLQPFSTSDIIQKEIGEEWWGDSRSALMEDISYYSFFEKELGINFRYSLMPLMALSENCCWWIALKNKILISENPEFAFYKPVGTDPGNNIPVLHKDGDAALKFNDDFCVYALNGIRVPKEIALTPSNQLDPKLILHESNVDVRREIVRKIGIERICQSLNAKTIDQAGNYELLLLDIGDERRRPYLKMKNPSIGVYHVEGVPPEISSVKEALAWRNGTEEIPLTIA